MSFANKTVWLVAIVFMILAQQCEAMKVLAVVKKRGADLLAKKLFVGGLSAIELPQITLDSKLRELKSAFLAKYERMGQTQIDPPSLQFFRRRLNLLTGPERLLRDLGVKSDDATLLAWNDAWKLTDASYELVLDSDGNLEKACVPHTPSYWRRLERRGSVVLAVTDPSGLTCKTKMSRVLPHKWCATGPFECDGGVDPTTNPLEILKGAEGEVVVGMNKAELTDGIAVKLTKKLTLKEEY